MFRARGGRGRSPLSEAFTLIAAALGARPKSSQGLLIAKSLYQNLGGHDAKAAHPEADLLRRLGRARIETLDVSMTSNTDSVN